MESAEIIKLVGQGGFLFLAVVAVTKYLVAQIERGQKQWQAQLEETREQLRICQDACAESNDRVIQAEQSRTEDAKAVTKVMIEMSKGFSETVNRVTNALERNGEVITNAAEEFRRASDERRRRD